MKHAVTGWRLNEGVGFSVYCGLLAVKEGALSASLLVIVLSIGQAETPFVFEQNIL
jgi:hypothetical protein